MDKLSDDIENLNMENKVLRRNNMLQSRQLQKCEKEEDQMPTTFDRQNKELKAMKQLLR